MGCLSVLASVLIPFVFAIEIDRDSAPRQHDDIPLRARGIDGQLLLAFDQLRDSIQRSIASSKNQCDLQEGPVTENLNKLATSLAAALSQPNIEPMLRPMGNGNLLGEASFEDVLEKLMATNRKHATDNFSAIRKLSTEAERNRKAASFQRFEKQESLLKTKFAQIPGIETYRQELSQQLERAREAVAKEQSDLRRKGLRYERLQMKFEDDGLSDEELLEYHDLISAVEDSLPKRVSRTTRNANRLSAKWEALETAHLDPINFTDANVDVKALRGFNEENSDMIREIQDRYVQLSLLKRTTAEIDAIKNVSLDTFDAQTETLARWGKVVKDLRADGLLLAIIKDEAGQIRQGGFYRPEDLKLSKDKRRRDVVVFQTDFSSYDESEETKSQNRLRSRLFSALGWGASTRSGVHVPSVRCQSEPQFVDLDLKERFQRGLTDYYNRATPVPPQQPRDIQDRKKNQPNKRFVI